jgi:hypothetical protein
MPTLNIHTIRGLECIMPNTVPAQISLLAHPTTPSDAVQSLDVQLSLPSPGLLTLRYNLRADMSRIRVGPEAVPGRAAELWKHTCFEAFIQPGGLRGYYEFNFSPTKQWAVYRFSAYREGMTPMDLSYPPEISVHTGADRLELEATFLSPISFATEPRPKLALTAVVEEDGGRLCYWSARHPDGKPDFHHSDGFALEL